MAQTRDEVGFGLPAKWELPAGIAALAAIFFTLAFSISSFPEVDAFYHLTHAREYLRHGPFWQEFPWHVGSVIGTRGADLWYGWHLLIAPFGLFGDPVLGLRVGTAVTLTAFATVLFVLARKEKLPWPLLWPLLAVAIVPAQVWRWMSLRPILFSVAVGAVIVVAASRGRVGWAAGLCAAISFVHPAFFWLGPFALAAVAVSKYLLVKELAWKPFALGLVAGAAGLFLRPDAMDALALLRVQLLELSAVQRENEFISFGSELYPLLKIGGWQPHIPFAVVLIAGLAYFGRKIWGTGDLRQDPRAVAWLAFAAMALPFGLLALFRTARGTDLYAAYGALALGYGVALALAREEGDREDRYSQLRLVTGIAAALIAAHGIIRTPGIISQYGRDVRLLEKAMTWLGSNSSPGDVVYATHWSFFGEMFFWNQSNRYITGMDPIFQYSHDQESFWRSLGIEQDVMAGVTTGAGPGGEPKPLNTPTWLRRTYGAKYVLVRPEFTPNFINYLLSDTANYRLVYADENSGVFEVLPQGP